MSDCESCSSLVMPRIARIKGAENCSHPVCRELLALLRRYMYRYLSQSGESTLHLCVLIAEALRYVQTYAAADEYVLSMIAQLWKRPRRHAPAFHLSCWCACTSPLHGISPE